MKVLLKFKVCPLHQDLVDMIKTEFPGRTDDELDLYFNPIDQRYYEKSAQLDCPYDIVDMTPEEYEYYVKEQRESDARPKD